MVRRVGSAPAKAQVLRCPKCERLVFAPHGDVSLTYAELRATYKAKNSGAMPRAVSSCQIDAPGCGWPPCDVLQRAVRGDRQHSSTAVGVESAAHLGGGASVHSVQEAEQRALRWSERLATMHSTLEDVLQPHGERRADPRAVRAVGMCAGSRRSDALSTSRSGR